MSLKETPQFFWVIWQPAFQHHNSLTPSPSSSFLTALTFRVKTPLKNGHKRLFFRGERKITMQSSFRAPSWQKPWLSGWYSPKKWPQKTQVLGKPCTGSFPVQSGVDSVTVILVPCNYCLWTRRKERQYTNSKVTSNRNNHNAILFQSPFSMIDINNYYKL